MTNTIKINALVASVLFLIGSFFKAFHWPGADVILVAGMAGLIIFLVLLIFSFRGNSTGGMEQFTRIFGAAALIVVLLAFLFKTLHLAGAQKLLWIGDVGIFLSFVFFLIDGFLEKDPVKWSLKFIAAIFILIIVILIMWMI
jgi:hypothetical protein